MGILQRFETAAPVRWIKTRMGGAGLFLLMFVTLALLTRMALLLKSAGEVSWNLTLLASFAWGVVYDVGAALWWSLPVVLVLMLLPAPTFQYRAVRGAVIGAIGVGFFLMLFSGVSEWTFWDEFGVRFNFIAVDYLVYTTEVIGNIRESYPMPLIIGGVALGAIGLTGMMVRTGLPQIWMEAAATPWRRRYATGLVWIVVAVSFGSLLSERWLPTFANNYNRELAKNGGWALFAAFWANQLEFDQFYETLPEDRAFAMVRENLVRDGSVLMGSEAEDTLRQISAMQPEQRPNVIQITVESLSASFMARYGNTDGITPELDKLVADSLVFDQFYATGTRTVRGMEALTLSLPPTPGRSLVKRPDNENLFSLGSVFQSKGYDTAFIYGGYGYFDNMNYFFGHNGYRIVDRGQVADEDITFANAWGACDEDLFDWSLREADATAKTGKPFFQFVMTTSNHRPFTYPEGRIDLPSKESRRNGGVKYTDYAIAKFLRDASTRPWYKDTIFVIVADHCASSAGKTTLPVSNYHIPLLIFAPGGQIEPGVVDEITSQVDYAPTLLGLLNWSYPSRFFGRDVMHDGCERPARAFVGTYQKMGLWDGERLAVLSPVRHKAMFGTTTGTEVLISEGQDDPLIQEATSYYQTASDLFRLDAYRAYTP